MKKTYIEPSISVKNAMAEYEFCKTSLNGETPYQGLDDTIEYGGGEPGDFSRQHSVWDEN